MQFVTGFFRVQHAWTNKPVIVLRIWTHMSSLVGPPFSLLSFASLSDSSNNMKSCFKGFMMPPTFTVHRRYVYLPCTCTAYFRATGLQVVLPLNSYLCTCLQVCSTLALILVLDVANYVGSNRFRQWMDIQHRPEDDFCSVQGFILSVRDTMRIKKGGLLWCGHPRNPFLAQS